MDSVVFPAAAEITEKSTAPGFVVETAVEDGREVLAKVDVEKCPCILPMVAISGEVSGDDEVVTAGVKTCVEDAPDISENDEVVVPDCITCVEEATEPRPDADVDMDTTVTKSDEETADVMAETVWDVKIDFNVVVTAVCGVPCKFEVETLPCRLLDAVIEVGCVICVGETPDLRPDAGVDMEIIDAEATVWAAPSIVLAGWTNLVSDDDEILTTPEATTLVTIAGVVSALTFDPGGNEDPATVNKIANVPVPTEVLDCQVEECAFVDADFRAEYVDPCMPVVL